jgi:hypothetical protein
MDAVAETKVAGWNANRYLNKLSALRGGLNLALLGVLGDSALLADVTSPDLTGGRHAVFSGRTYLTWVTDEQRRRVPSGWR